MSETFEHISCEDSYKKGNEIISFVICPDCEKISYDSENRICYNKKCRYNLEHKFDIKVKEPVDKIISQNEMTPDEISFHSNYDIQRKNRERRNWQ